jgi:mannosyltransferase
VGFLAAFTWAPHLPDSLWLDETLTAWVIQGSFGEMIERSVDYQSQSAYYVFLWFWTRVVGSSEVALRLPSLLSALGACAILAQLGTRWTRDRETGLLAMVILASTWSVFRESVDARSYMPGLFVLLCVVLFLVRWLDTGRWWDACLCGAFAGLTPHFHLFLVLTYPAFFAYAALRWHRSRGSIAQLAVVGSLLLIGALLFLPFLQTIVANGSDYSVAPRPDWISLCRVFVFVAPVAGLLVGLCASGVLVSTRADATEPIPDRTEPISREVGVLLALWMLAPLLILYSVSVSTDKSVFLERFLMPAIPAVCLFYAFAVRAIPARTARVLAMVVIALASFVTNVRPQDDFRGAVRFVNQFAAEDVSVPTLFASGLIEGQHESWLRDPSHAAYLQAPMAYYPLDGPLVTLPRRLRGQAIGIEIVDPILESSRRFATIEWTGNGAKILQWLVPRAEEAGFRVTVRTYGTVRVALFNRTGRKRHE